MKKLKESNQKEKTFKPSKPIYPYHIVCKAKQRNEVYIDPHGIVMPCCWLGIHIRKVYTNFYLNGDPTPKELNITNGRYIDGLDENYLNWLNDFFDIIEEEGGIEAFSLNHHSIEDILTNEFYMHKLETLWRDKNCKFCANHCATNREKSKYSCNKINLVNEVGV
jgi:hypothetical protein